MVDLQAHVLPGLDDGAADEATAIEMCRAAAREGTRELVATPNCDGHSPFDRGEIEAKTAALQARLDGALHLHTGTVLELSHESLREAMADLSRFSINSRRYVLLRPSTGALTRGVAKLLTAIQDCGYTSIISLPETSKGVQNDLRRVRHWIKRGSLVAVGADSLLGRNGTRAEECVTALLDAELVHFIVSNARSAGRGTPSLDQAFHVVVYRWGEDRAQRLLIDNPWAALWGQPIKIPRPKRLDKTFSIRGLLGLESARKNQSPRNESAGSIREGKLGF
jgi:protein-tyrosine phosphatase